MLSTQVNNRQSSALTIIVFFTISFVSSYNWIAMKIGIQYSDPLTFVALRNLLGAFVLFFAAILMKKDLKPKAFTDVLILGLFQTTLLQLFSALALKNGEANKTALLVFLMPFWTLLLSKFFLKEKINKIQFVSIIIAFFGVIFILEPWNRKQLLLSDIFAILCGISWSVSTIWMKKISDKQHLDLTSVTAWQMFLGSIPLLVIAYMQPTNNLYFSHEFLLSLAFCGILGSALSWLLWFFIVKNLTAMTASLNTLLIPIFTVIFAWVQLNERPVVTTFIGMGVVLIALAIFTISKNNTLSKHKN